MGLLCNIGIRTGRIFFDSDERRLTQMKEAVGRVYKKKRAMEPVGVKKLVAFFDYPYF